MSIFNAINISASGLTAERIRMDVISKNIANANTTRTVNGGPYRRQMVVFKNQEESSFSQVLNNIVDKGKTQNPKGVEVIGIRNDQSPFKQVYDPGHPDANAEGYVLMPNVEIVTEMADMISASRAYEANITAMNTTKNMALKALEIGR